MSVGTPDYTRGIVSAQKQLAFLNHTSDTATVGVPPNAEALVIATPTNSLLSTPVCLGLTTALNYPAVRVGGFLGSLGATHWMFDVSSALDSQVQITWPGAHLEQWWVYSDAAARLVVNPTQSSSQTGVQYVIPTVPSTVASDHPPNELLYAANWAIASGGVLVPAPGVGQRLRVFYASVANESAGAIVGLSDSVSGASLVLAGIGAAGIPQTADFKPSGVPLSNNAAIVVATTSGNATANVTYTAETI